MMRLLSNPSLFTLSATLCVAALAHAQAPAKPTTPQEQYKADIHKLPAETGQIVDRIAAIVNGDIVLESDVEEEERFTRLDPTDSSKDSPRDAALHRIIDRTLIQQQQRGLAQPAVTDADVNKDEADMRKHLPGCDTADCKSDAGWKSFLATYGFTPEELRARLRQREAILRFVETRFRSGTRVTEKEIDAYYTNTMLPEYARRNVPAPPEDTLEDRISDILIEQHVSALLDDWLKTLRDSGRVRIMQPGTEAQ